MRMNENFLSRDRAHYFIDGIAMRCPVLIA